jgi:glycosyltransferase involved in cell wall biosynthesis
MKILLVPASDWLGHPLSSRLHFIFERLSETNEIHVIEYPIRRGKKRRRSKLVIHEAKGFPLRDLSQYYALNALFHLKSLDDILRHNEFDVIVFANILTGLDSVILGRSHGVPIVFDYLDHFPESASAYYVNPFIKKLVEMVVLRVTKWNLEKADQVVTVSNGFIQLINNLGVKNISLIPNGVDINKFEKMERNMARERLGYTELLNKFIITYIGSVEPWYDLDVVAKANDSLNQKGISSVFQIVGGRLASGCNSGFTFSSSNVCQTGFVDYSFVPLYINASDVCVLPLKKMTKNLTRPVKLLEYFSCGKPVFSLPNSEIEQEFGDAVTFFHDDNELSALLFDFVKDPQKFSTKINKGFDYAKLNSWNAHARSYEKLLKDIVENRRKKSS